MLIRFGRGWQHYYRVDWAALPRLVCDMQQANMDVHIMETLGCEEKCVDIQMAVETN